MPTLPRRRPLAALIVVALVAGLVATTAPAASAVPTSSRVVAWSGVPVTGARVGQTVTFSVFTQPDNRAVDKIQLASYSQSVCRVLGYDRNTFKVTVELLAGGACDFMFSSERYASGSFLDLREWGPATGGVGMFVDGHRTRTVVIEDGPTGPVSGDQIAFTAYTAPDHAPVDMIYSITGSCRLADYNRSTLRVTLNVIGNGRCSGVLHSNPSTNGTLAHRIFDFDVADPRQAQRVYLHLEDRPSWPDPTPIGGTSDSGGPLTYTTSTPDVCAIDGANFIPRKAGRCWITAHQAGNQQWWAASATDFFDMKVTDRPQTIDFPFISGMRMGDERWMSKALNITASSGLPLDIRSDTSWNCYVSDGVVYATNAGTCTITARQYGVLGSWNPASAQRSFIIEHPWDFYLPPDPNAMLKFPAIGTREVIDAPFTIVATGGPPVTVTSLSPGTCAVSVRIVTPVAPGVCTLRAFQAGNQYQPPAIKEQSFLLTLGSHTIDFATLPGRSYIDPDLTLDATATSGLPVTYTTSTPDVCSVTGEVVATAGVGVCTIRAEAGNDLWAPTAHEQSFLISPAAHTLNFEELPDRTYGDGGPQTLTATTTSELPVTYTASTPEVCALKAPDDPDDPEVDVLTVLTAGECVVHATSGNEVWETTSVDRSFDIAPGTQTLDFAAIADVPANADAFTPPATASSGLPVTLATTTPAVCAVTGGEVELLKVGRCTVTAHAGSASWTPVAGEQSFNVTVATQTLNLEALVDRPYSTQARPLSVTASSGLPVTITTTTPAVCTVTDDGLLVTHQAGLCTVTAATAVDDAWESVTGERSFEVTRATQRVNLTGLRGTPLSAASLTVAATSDAGLPATVATRTPAVCTVLDGVVKLQRAGRCAIAGTAEGNTNIAPAPANVVAFPVWATPAVAARTRVSRIHRVLGAGEQALRVNATTPAKCRAVGGRLVVLAPGVCRATVLGPRNQVLRQVTTTAAAPSPGKGLAQIRRAATVYFAPQSATLTPRGRAALEKAAPGLGAASLVVVYGHTHAGGRRGERPALSTARANRVAAFLMRHGVKVRPTTVALGAGQHSGGGKASLNRRAQVRFLN